MRRCCSSSHSSSSGLFSWHIKSVLTHHSVKVQAKSYRILIPRSATYCTGNWICDCWPAACVGFMSRDERKKFEGLHSPYNKYWIPCVWFTNLAAVARCEGRIKDDHTLKLLLEVQHYTHTHTHTHTHSLSHTSLGHTSQAHWWYEVSVLVFWQRFSWRCISTQT